MPLPEILRRVMGDHLERTGRSGDDLLFGRTASQPFTPGYVSECADEAWAVAAAGAFLTGTPLAVEVRRFTLHEGRHSYSTFLDAAGISETRADRYMGHSNVSVANRYRHQLAGQLVDDAPRLDEYLAGASAGKIVPLVATGAHAGAHHAEAASLSQTA